MSEQNGETAAAGPIVGDVKVLEVGTEDRLWESEQGGKFIGYRIKLQLPDGTEVGNVEVNTKADNPRKFEVGSTVFGKFDPRPGHKFGPRFQKKSQGGGGGGGGGGKKSPLEQARIQRQHSQEMGIRIGTAAGWFTGIDPTDGDAIVALIGKHDGPLTKLIDLIDHDIDRGAQKALERKQGGSDGSQ